MVAGCAPAALPPPPTVSPDCSTVVDADEADLQIAERFTGSVFASRRWERSVGSEPLKATAMWQDHDLGALAYLEVLIYGCGHTPGDISDYFNQRNFETIFFQDYDALVGRGVCRHEPSDLTLWQFSAGHQGVDYDLRLWVVPYGPARVIDVLLVFPADSAGQIDSYAEALFPELPACE